MMSESCGSKNRFHTSQRHSYVTIVSCILVQDISLITINENYNLHVMG